MAIADYKATASSNSTISGINIAENCPPGNVNDALRQIMADLRAWYDAGGQGAGEADLAARATRLATARTIALSGGATGTATAFDGTQNIAIPVTALDMGKASAGTLATARGGTGRTDGSVALADAAAKWNTARKLSLSAGASGAATFDGSADATLSVTGLNMDYATSGVLPVARGGTGGTTGISSFPTPIKGSLYQNPTSVGEWRLHTSHTLPPGGTWAYILWSRYIDDDRFNLESATVAAGGTKVDLNGYHSAVFCWRIA